MIMANSTNQEATPMDARICTYCHKKLRKICENRTNGTTRHHDWATRKMHKKCWKEELKDLRLADYIRENNLTPGPWMDRISG